MPLTSIGIFPYFCTRKKRNKKMARPIKETPILYGEEALQFEMRMMDPLPIAPEMLENILNDYEFLRTRCVNCSF